MPREASRQVTRPPDLKHGECVACPITVALAHTRLPEASHQKRQRRQHRCVCQVKSAPFNIASSAGTVGSSPGDGKLLAIGWSRAVRAGVGGRIDHDPASRIETDLRCCSPYGHARTLLKQVTAFAGVPLCVCSGRLGSKYSDDRVGAMVPKSLMHPSPGITAVAHAFCSLSIHPDAGGLHIANRMCWPHGPRRRKVC